MRGEAAPAFVYVPALPEPGASGWIEGEERHHLVNVCRAAPGEMATATDGRGRRARIRIGAIGPRVAFEVETLETVERTHEALIACGVPEGARVDWLIEKLAELGVSAFQPLETSRGRWRWSPGRAARCERLATAALKQSQRAHRLEVRAPAPIEAWLGSVPPGNAPRWLADPRGALPGPIGPGRFTGVSGPAGGFTNAEREVLLTGGFEPVRLGGGVLRAETAGVALAVLWAAAESG